MYRDIGEAIRSTYPILMDADDSWVIVQFKFNFCQMEKIKFFNVTYVLKF